MDLWGAQSRRSLPTEQGSTSMLTGHIEVLSSKSE
jgi:hypothetical protein